jgi:hypothetical protein
MPETIPVLLFPSSTDFLCSTNKFTNAFFSFTVPYLLNFVRTWNFFLLKVQSHQICVKFTRLRRGSECTVQGIHNKCTRTGCCTLYLVLGVQQARVMYRSFFLFNHIGRPLWVVQPRWRMENGKCEVKQNENENVFLGPQSLFICKRNCSTRAVESVSCSASLPFLSRILQLWCFMVLSFCSSVLVFPMLEEPFIS